MRSTLQTATVLLLLIFTQTAIAQKRQGKTFSLAVTNSQSAHPFSKFGSLFTKEVHPGFEAGYVFQWRSRQKHDWYQSFKAGYFYHRFVQHAIPIYTQLGYRYKLKDHWRFTSALGAGYLHSIPDVDVFELNEAGEYEKAKGLGRPQALFNITLGVEYRLALSQKRPLTLFLNYQQQLQAPFINAYVPLLPYNNIALGVSLPFKTTCL